ncbi:hypothetical protein Tco_0674551 [Tanacetum coccineum]
MVAFDTADAVEQEVVWVQLQPQPQPQPQPRPQPQGADPPASDSEVEAEAEAEAEVAPIQPPVPANPIPEAVTIGTGRLTPLKRLFTDTQVWTGSSSSAAAAGHNPEDLTPSHIRSDLDALHRRVRHIEEDDVRADNKRLKMMLDCSENRTRDWCLIL